jgi:hypothetical protein
MEKPDSPEATGGRIGDFLRRHSRTVQSIGVLIVFATFFVKDVLREREKEFGDNLAAAQRQFAVRANLSEITAHIDTILQTLDMSHQAQPNALSEKELRLAIQTLLHSALGAKVSAENLCELAKAVSGEQDRAAQCHNVETTGVFITKLSAAGDNLGGFAGKSNGQARLEFLNLLRNEFYSIALNVDADFGGAALLQHANHQKEVNERRRGFLNTIYYTLFITGIALGALGTYYGIKGIGGGG